MKFLLSRNQDRLSFRRVEGYAFKLAHANTPEATRLRRANKIKPNLTEVLSTAKERFGTAVLQGLSHYSTLERQVIHTAFFPCAESNAHIMIIHKSFHKSLHEIKIRFDTRCSVWIRRRANVAPKLNQTQLLGSAHEWSGVWTGPNTLTPESIIKNAEWPTERVYHHDQWSKLHLLRPPLVGASQKTSHKAWSQDPDAEYPT